MKKSILVILTSAFVPIASFAQFNTIGDVMNHQTVKIKINPSEYRIAPKDSIRNVENMDSVLFNSGGVLEMEEKKNLIPCISYPLKRIHINSEFGMRLHPIYHRYIMHNGIDLKARYENVYSMFHGLVTAASYSSGGGYYVTVDYGVCECSFLHLSRIDVRKGQKVFAGQKIGVSGNTGTRTTSPHLHLSCKWNDTGQYFDPQIILVFITNVLQKYNNTK